MSELPLKFGLRLRTVRSLVTMEDWMDDNCLGEWSLVLLNMDELMEEKEVEIRFADINDKSNFIDFYKGNSSSFKTRPRTAEEGTGAIR